MTIRFARPLAQLTVIMALAAGMGACSTIADLDPTGLLSDDATPAADNSAAASPELANVPGAPTTSDDQKQVASSLAADSTKTQYSADALRAGTEAAAPPPGAAAPVSQQALAAPSASDAPPTANDAPPTASPPVPVTAANAPPPSAQRTQAASAAPPLSSAPIAVSNAPASSDVAPVRTAALPPSAAAAASMPPPGAEPAVPAVPPNGAIHSNMMATPTMSDAALGFRPSAAPPLDPSVSNFVSAPILSRYRQTASLAGSAGTGMPAVAAVPGRGRGGPDMSGDVVANLDAQPGAAANALAAMNGGVAPTAVIYFAGDGTSLSVAARSQVRSAVAAFKAGGGVGTVRVVGHAASRTTNMPVEKHLEVIFQKSQLRANAVAQELIHQGVPADKVLIEAVGDSQPVYYESMPKGEDGNRRAEIFVQS